MKLPTPFHCPFSSFKKCVISLIKEFEETEFYVHGFVHHKTILLVLILLVLGLSPNLATSKYVAARSMDTV
jgi:hypothetical protein